MRSQGEPEDILNVWETRTSNVADCRIVWRIVGQGQPLLLLHGNFGAWSHWVRNVETLSRRYLLLIPDLPGFGESDMPPEPYSVESVAKLLLESAMTFVDRGTAVSVVGFSFGSNLAGAMAALCPRSVRELVLVSCGTLGLPRAPIAFARWRHLTERSDRDRAHRANLAAQMIGDPAHIDSLAVSIQATNAERRRFPAEDLSTAIPVRTFLPKVTCPISAIYGDADRSIGPYMQTRIDFFKALRGDINIAIIKGAGHWLPYETPDSFETALTMVLNEPRAGWTRYLPER